MRELFTAPLGEGKSETGDGVAGWLPWEDFLSGHFRGPLSSLHGPDHQTYEIPHGWKVFLEKLFLQTLNPSGLLFQDTRRGTEKGGGNLGAG